jgi:hypothetical protein
MLSIRLNGSERIKLLLLQKHVTRTIISNIKLLLRKKIKHQRTQVCII